ncbi:S-adenosyl-L-methionine-dependent methyltransferase [Xylaria cubensis]|nr:S-adenosyl-L-methionine-dependent methyltransferase [Xylaria cubensis]
MRKETISAAEIANEGNADEILIRRLLRVLTAAGYVAEKGDGLYGPTNYTMHINDRLAQGMIKFIYDASMLPIAQGANWLKETAYQNPEDVRQNKELWDNANTFFEGDRGSRPSWLSWFPVKDKFFPEHQQKTLLLVDVAGGRGHDLMEFLTNYPEEPGPFILQDQGIVLPSLSPRITKQSFDLFADSPVQGARIYFMKFILHDYVDDQCLHILGKIKATMVKRYSINEFILPDTDCGLLQSQWDLMMMVLFSSMERTESQWRTLLGAAGLSIEGMYSPPGDGQGIIVATL